MRSYISNYNMIIMERSNLLLFTLSTAITFSVLYILITHIMTYATAIITIRCRVIAAVPIMYFLTYTFVCIFN